MVNSFRNLFRCRSLNMQIGKEGAFEWIINRLEEITCRKQSRLLSGKSI
nr:MAG TPA: hypothetical protein [Caudoviricetes sp.]